MSTNYDFSNQCFLYTILNILWNEFVTNIDDIENFKITTIENN